MRLYTTNIHNLYSGGEVAVLDYMAQQHKIIPQLAAVYALNFANRDLNTFYEQTVTELEVGNLTNLPEVSEKISS